MRRIFPSILLLMAFSVLEAAAQSNVERIGLLNSLKGFGITAEMSNPRTDRDSKQTFTIFADMQGIYVEEADVPGIKLMFHDLNVVKRGVIREEVGYAMYVGGGWTFGYVRDYAKGARNHGPMAGIAGSTGVIFIFPGHIDISLDFTGEFALQLRRDEVYNSLVDLSWYANGVFKSFLPQITLFYRF